MRCKDCIVLILWILAENSLSAFEASNLPSCINIEDADSELVSIFDLCVGYQRLVALTFEQGRLEEAMELMAGTLFLITPSLLLFNAHCAHVRALENTVQHVLAKGALSRNCLCDRFDIVRHDYICLQLISILSDEKHFTFLALCEIQINGVLFMVYPGSERYRLLDLDGPLDCELQELALLRLVENLELKARFCLTASHFGDFFLLIHVLVSYSLHLE